MNDVVSACPQTIDQAEIDMLIGEHPNGHFASALIRENGVVNLARMVIRVGQGCFHLVD